MGYSDLALRRKHLWVFRGDGVELSAIRAVASEAVSTGAATEGAVDRRSDGPEPRGTDDPGRVTALLHLYDLAPEAVARIAERATGLGGLGYEILERAVFDRRQGLAGMDWGAGWNLIGTQTRRPGLDRRDFVRHWGAGHAELVRAHHPGLSRYVQNYVVTHDAGAVGFDGFFEGYFMTQDDWDVRLYDSPEGERLLADDAASFLDEGATEWIWVERERFGPDWAAFAAR